jgi:methyl-accepting chemotaxis protein
MGQLCANPAWAAGGEMFRSVIARNHGLGASVAVLDLPNATDGLVKAIDRSLAMIQFDPEGRILDANGNFLAAMGYTLAEIQGKHHRIFVEPAYAQSREYEEFWATLRRGEFDAAVYKRLGKGGREVWIQASYNPVFGADGRVARVVKFATDVTGQTRKNADFEGQIKALHRVQGIIEFDLDGTIRTANDLFLNLTGYSLAEIQGRHHRIFVDPQEAATEQYKEFWRSLAAGRADTHIFKRFGKNGKTIWLQASYIPVLDPSGQPIKVIKFANDLTGIMSQSLSTQRNAECVAAENEEMSCSIAEISRNMELSRQTAETILAASSETGTTAKNLVASMDSVEKIVGLIREIANRVNILALNAAIEAARAGEAGRGFAVVASEVKNLSDQTAKATDEIALEIGAVQTISSKVASSIEQTIEGVDLMNRYVTSVATAIEQQSAVTRNISEHSSQMVRSVVEMIERMQRKS